MTCLVEAPTTLSPCPPDVAVRFKRGRAKPRAIAWFGFSAFWGHLRHLLASAIATDNVDSRQWMQPDDPADLLLRVREVLRERGAGEGSTLVQVMGGEVWIDFVADTGDDVSVSLAVAKLVAREYSVPGANGDAALTLPRGHVLIHGGDLAYPVATVREMSRRLLDPWNHVLEAAEGTDAPRVLFGVPGNHDWYDGLDGFARMFRSSTAPVRNDDVELPKVVIAWQSPRHFGPGDAELDLLGTALATGKALRHSVTENFCSVGKSSALMPMTCAPAARKSLFASLKA